MTAAHTNYTIFKNKKIYSGNTSEWLQVIIAQRQIQDKAQEG